MQRPKRRLCVDVMRGFLIWNSFLMDALVIACKAIPASALSVFFMQQFEHSEWGGFHYMDAGFTGYMLLIGASMTFSYECHRQEGRPKSQYFFKILQRAVLLWIFSFFWEGGFSLPINEISYSEIFFELSVYILATGILLLCIPPRFYVAALVVFLVAHTAFFTLINVPGYGQGDFSMDGNSEHYVHMLVAPYITGILGDKSAPALVDDIAFYFTLYKTLGTSLIGLILGRILMLRISYQRQALLIYGIGIAAMFAGLCLGHWVPINKPLWTPSFTLFASGFIFLYIAAFIQLTEIWHWQRFSKMCMIFGRNSLLAWVCFFYLIPFNNIAQRLFGEIFKWVFGLYAPLPMAIAPAILCWLFFFWLQKRGLIKPA